MRKKKSKWSLNDQIYFLSHIGQLISKGYSLLQAILLVASQMREKRKQEIDVSVQQLKEGRAVYEVFDSLNFSKEFVSYLYFAEKYGDLSHGFINGSEMLKKRLIFQKKIVAILRYPLFLLWFLTTLSLFLYQYLLPQFSTLYSTFKTDQPMLVQIFLKITSSFPSIVIMVIIFVLIPSIYLFYKLRALTPYSRMNFYMKIPILNKALRIKNTHYFSIQLSSLLFGGLSIQDALTVFESQHHLPFYQEVAKQLKKNLIEGCSISDLLKSNKCFDNQISTIILHGQANGTLAVELFDYSHLLIEKLERLGEKGLMYLQPITFSFIGILILLMYASIMLPIFQMIEQL